MQSPLSALVACDDREVRRALGSILTDLGVNCFFASSVDQAREILAGQQVCLAFCQDSLPDGSFRDVLLATKAAGSRIPLVVCCLFVKMDEYLEAMQLGAFDFIAFPIRGAEVESILNNLLVEYSSGKKEPQVISTTPSWAQKRRAAS